LIILFIVLLLNLYIIKYMEGIDNIPLATIITGKIFKEKIGNIQLYKGFNNNMLQYDLQYYPNRIITMLKHDLFDTTPCYNGLHFTDGIGIKFWKTLLKLDRVFLVTVPDDAFVICINKGKYCECKSTALILIKELKN